MKGDKIVFELPEAEIEVTAEGQVFYTTGPYLDEERVEITGCKLAQILLSIEELK